MAQVPRVNKTKADVRGSGVVEAVAEAWLVPLS